MLLAALAEYSFLFVRCFLTLLAKELNFGLVGGVVAVAVGAANLLTGDAPQRAFGIFIAFLTFYIHLFV